MTREFNFKEGDGFSFERFVSAADVKKFAEIVGDSNPIHLDESFAKRSFFKKRIVHGAFLGGLISKALGVDFPGEGAVYISQNSAFKRPVFVDSIVRVEIKVTQVNSEKRRLALDTTILNADGKACLVGSAEVWLPE
ncbi:MAG: phosphate acetyltransferase [Anaerolineaceae bacterium]|nr:MAG: phosphate acetyltransferase [Anaerolineaceae bacterium]